MKRATLFQDAQVSGVGLFTGQPATCTIRPADAGSGIRFVRVDHPGVGPIGARVDRLSARPVHPAFAGMAPRCTILEDERNTCTLATVEHLLSALAGLGITDATIDVVGPEIPICDGSARAFVEAIRTAGIHEHQMQIEPIVITERVTVEESGGATLVAMPTDRPPTMPGCAFEYELDYGSDSPIPPQRASWNSWIPNYEAMVAGARTYCLEHEAVAMRSAGLFAGLSPADMLVVGSAGPIDNAYRYDNEPARHKLLDLIGDLSLVGGPIHGRIVARRSGHALNHEMARRLVSRFGSAPASG